MAKVDILVSVVAVVRDNALVLPAFVEEASGVLKNHYTNFELILIDNGSADETENVVRGLLEMLPSVRYFRLTRPSDDETAVMAGLDAAIGDYVVTLDPDLDPPTELVPIVDKCRSGTDLVMGVDRHPPRLGLVYTILRKVFLALARRLISIELLSGTTGLRAISRQGVNALVKVRLRRRDFEVLVADIGLKRSSHPYDRMSRSGRQPSRSLPRAVRTGLSVLVHNSITPLRVASGLGLIGSFISLLYSLYVIVVYLFKPVVMPGWATLSLAMSGLFSLSFLMLALIGEYLGRLLEESADRPLYHVRDELSSAVMLVDLTRRNVLDQS